MIRPVAVWDHPAHILQLAVAYIRQNGLGAVLGRTVQHHVFREVRARLTLKRTASWFADMANAIGRGPDVTVTVRVVLPGQARGCAFKQVGESRVVETGIIILLKILSGRVNE